MGRGRTASEGATLGGTNGGAGCRPQCDAAYPGRCALVRLAVAYVALAFAGTWACWGASVLLGHAVVPHLGGTGASAAAGVLSTLAGALRPLGTLMPLLAAYALFPQVRACGLAGGPSADAQGATRVACDDGRPGAPSAAPDGAGSLDGSASSRDAGAEDAPDPRAGFLAFAFGARPRLGGWLFFVVLAVWRWAMFRAAFGFPATPGDALASFLTTLPALLVGGGLEEVGWRGVLQPALGRLLGDRMVGTLAAPLLTGLIWACWHLPLFWMGDTYQSQSDIPFAAFAGIAVALSYTLGALRSATGGVLGPILAHAWYNAMLVAPLAPSAVGAALFAAEAVICAVVLLALRRREARGAAGARCEAGAPCDGGASGRVGASDDEAAAGCAVAAGCGAAPDRAAASDCTPASGPTVKKFQK